MDKQTNMFRCDLRKEENKIFIYFNNSQKVEVSISIQDVDSGHAIYAFDTHFENYSSVWTTPIPVNALNHYNRSGYFRGYVVKIYERDRHNLKEEHVLWYNEDAPSFDRYFIESDPWNLTWINYTEMFVENFYNPLSMDIHGTCLDIGANDGLYTEYLLKNGADRVYAIECDPRSVKFLNKKYHNHEKVVVVDKALFSENKTGLKLAYKEDTSTVSSLLQEVHHFNEGNYYEVDAWDYSTLLNKYNIGNVDFFKIDIEGAEYDVFRSMSDFEILHIKAFMVEIHWNKNGRIYEITDRLEKLGFQIQLRRHTIDNEVVLEKEDWKNYDLCTFYAWKKPETNQIEEQAQNNYGGKKTNVHMHHLRTTLNTDVEKQSLENIKFLSEFLRMDERYSEIKFTEYENEPFKDIPPRENCARPDAVSLRPFPNGVNENGQTALTPAHYGCYDAFKKAFLNKDNEFRDTDFHIFFEGDAFIDDFDLFADCLSEISDAIRDGKSISYISFGGIHHLETGEKLSYPDGNINGIDWGYYSKHVPFAHCIIIPSIYMIQMRSAFENEPWDVADLFFMNHFKKFPSHRQFVSKHQIARQLNGFSLIDKKVKLYQHK